MAQERDKLESLLFPREGGAQLVNFKLHRSAGDAVSEAFVRDEIHSALVQAWVTGQARTESDFPRSTAQPVDVRAMVARL